tara:strand:+ start:960 stop:1316 length:357 start_codon:yes stop_codon:yes gene_type:complete
MYGKMNKMNTMKKGGKKKKDKKNMIDFTGPAGRATSKSKFIKNPITGRTRVITKQTFDPSDPKGKEDFSKDVRVYNRKGEIIKTKPTKVKKRRIPKNRRYREGGSNNASYSYQDFLDL